MRVLTMVVSAVELKMKTDKKKITITLTALEAQWLNEKLEQIETARETNAQPRDRFMAASLQDRIKSES